MEITQNRSEEIYKNYLEHHQIEGGKWGVMHGPPYPLSKAISTGKRLKKKVSDSRGASVAKYKAKVAKKAQIESVKKAEKQQKEEAKKENEKMKKKAQILKSRSSAQVYKHANLFTDQELKDIKERLTLESDIRKISTPLVDKGRKFVDNISILSDGLNNTANAIANGTKVYNNVARFMNDIYGSDMKIVNVSNNNEGGNNGKKKKKKT